MRYRCPYCGDECPHLEAYLEYVERLRRDMSRRMAGLHLPIWKSLREEMAGMPNPIPRLIENADMEIWRLERELDSG